MIHTTGSNFDEDTTGVTVKENRDFDTSPALTLGKGELQTPAKLDENKNVESDNDGFLTFEVIIGIVSCSILVIGIILAVVCIIKYRKNQNAH